MFVKVLAEGHDFKLRNQHKTIQIHKNKKDTNNKKQIYQH